MGALVRFVCTLSLIFSVGVTDALATIQPLHVVYALVEVTPNSEGPQPFVTISLHEGVPPAGAATHLYGVPTVTAVLYGNNWSETPLAKGPSTIHLYRYYVLGVPPRLRIADLVGGTITTIAMGDPPLTLAGQAGQGCGVMFPDSHFIGCVGGGTGYIVSATIGHYRKLNGPSANHLYSGVAELSIGLMPVGNVYIDHGSGVVSHESYSAWLSSPSTSPSAVALQIANLNSTYAGVVIAGGEAGRAQLRYVIGY